MGSGIELNSEFVKRISSQIGDADAFYQVLDTDGLATIRLNPNKLKDTSDLPSGELVPWNKFGRILPERPKYNQDPFYHAGLYYPMEASSMFLSWVLDQIDLEVDDVILDLCAAPGGKSLIINDHFPDNVLVSNEIDAKRVHVLKENSIRWGTHDHIVINSDASVLSRSNLKYDLILVDAPCSGEGLFRKDKLSRGEWTSEKAHGCALRQCSILDDTVPMLQPGGYLIYSTCTYNKEENIDQVDRLINEYGFESVPITLPENENIEIVESETGLGYQFWPHRISGEGFFIAVLRGPQDLERHYLKEIKVKSDHPRDYSGPVISNRIIEKLDDKYFAFSKKELTTARELMKFGKTIKKGIYLGEIKGKDFIPSYDYAMSIYADEFNNTIDLELSDTMEYLKGHALNLSVDRGPVLITYMGHALGFGKSNGRRINNLYPKHLRIHQ